MPRNVDSVKSLNDDDLLLYDSHLSSLFRFCSPIAVIESNFLYAGDDMKYPTEEQIRIINSVNTTNKLVCGEFDCDIMKGFGRPCIFTNTRDVGSKNISCPHDKKTIRKKVLLIEDLGNMNSKW
jgi:hypothetical protein